MSGPEISIVIPAFDAEAVLGRALRSILRQATPVSEIVVVDDGSRDRTADVARSYPGILRLLQQANRGPGAARNRGIQACSGDLIGFVDADDELLPDMTSRLVAALDRFPEAAVASGGHLHESGGVCRRRPVARLAPRDEPTLIANFFDVARRHDIVLVGTVLVRREALHEVGAFREDIRFGEDLDLWARLAGRYDWAYVNAPLMIYHHNTATSATLRTPESAKPADFIARPEELGAVLRPQLRAGYDRYRRDMLLRQARSALARGEMDQARRLIALIQPGPANLEWAVTSLLSRSRPLSRAVLGCTALARHMASRLDGTAANENGEGNPDMT